MKKINQKKEPKEIQYLLSEIIERQNISISDLAEKSKLERKSIYNILNGNSDPNICTLVRLAKVLNVKVDELIKY